MSTATTELSIDDIRNLLPVLTKQQKEILLFSGTGNLDMSATGFSRRLDLQKDTIRSKKIAIRDQLVRVKKACLNLGVPLTDILKIPLDAPVEILRLPLYLINKLKQFGYDICRVSDLFKQGITNQVLLDKNMIGPITVSDMNRTLELVSLPKLGEASTESAIYQFFNPKKRQRLEAREIYLLKTIEWGNNDPEKIATSSEVDLPAPGSGMIWPIIKLAKRKLTAN